SFLTVNAKPFLNNMMALQWFSFLDDIAFGDDGVPDPTLGFVQREGKYSWAYMCRELSATSSIFPSPVELSVVVYNGRSLQLNNGTMQPSGENTYMAQFPSSNLI